MQIRNPSCKAFRASSMGLSLALVLALSLGLSLTGCATTDETRAEAEYERCQPGSGLVRTTNSEPPEWMKPPKKGTCLNLTGPRQES